MIGGMDCAGCASTLQSTLRRCEGVSFARVSFLSKLGEFGFDPQRTAAATLQRVIERAGFSANAVSSAGADGGALLLLRVSDVRSAVTALQAVPGVLACEECAATDEGVVKCRFDPEVAGPRGLLAAVAGAQLYKAPSAFELEKLEQRRELRLLALKLLLAAALTVPLVLIAFFLPLNEAAHASLSRVLAGGVTVAMVVSFVLCSLVMALLGPALYRSAYQSLRFQRAFNMNFLVMLSSTVAFLYSAAVMFALFASPPHLSPEVFFETPAILLTLIVFGQTLEKVAMRRSVRFVAGLKETHESTALLLLEDGREREVDTALLGRGDTVRLIPGARVPADGRVLEGVSAADESLLTGEAAPVPKRPGSAVCAGSVNQEGALLVRVTRMPGESTLARMCDFVDAALAEKLPVERVTDRVAHYFVPVVLALGVVTFFVWFALAFMGAVATSASPVLFALRFAVAVLVVSCPCAVALAVPTVVVVATGAAARRGVLVKGATVWEAARTLDTVVFDKTGSLTHGNLSVVVFKTFGDALDRMSALAALVAAEADSEHLVAKAVRRFAEREGLAPECVPHAEAFGLHPGLGVECTLDGRRVLAGSLALLAREGVPVRPALVREARLASANGQLAVFLACEGQLRAAAFLSDSVRSESASIVAHLARRGMQVLDSYLCVFLAHSRPSSLSGLASERRRGAGSDGAGAAAGHWVGAGAVGRAARGQGGRGAAAAGRGPSRGHGGRRIQ